MSTKRYCKFNSTLVTPRQRSIRINGLSTCIRLEEIYWNIIEVMARQESISVGKLLSRWAMEIELGCDFVRNFTGYVRVICVVQLIKGWDTLQPGDIDHLVGEVSPVWNISR
jgi:predicted DNA-binding ribbon-helix-helix protein